MSIKEVQIDEEERLTEPFIGHREADEWLLEVPDIDELLKYMEYAES